MSERLCRRKLHLFSGRQCAECVKERRAALEAKGEKPLHIRLCRRKLHVFSGRCCKECKCASRRELDRARSERFVSLGLTAKGTARKIAKRHSEEARENKRRASAARKKRSRLANLERHRAMKRAQVKRARANNRDKFKVIDSRKDAVRRDSLSDSYVRKALGLAKDAAPESLVLCKREQLMLHRLNLQLKKAITQKRNGDNHDSN